MRTSSAKAKGRRACQDVALLLYKYTPSLKPGDIDITSSGVTGEDIRLSPAAREVYPFVIECKNQESINIHKSYEQATTNKKIEPHLMPVVYYKRNTSELMVTMAAEDFVKLITER